MGGANVYVITLVSAAFLQTQEAYKNITVYTDNHILKTCLHIARNLRGIIRFHVRCKRMRFHIVFAGTCIP